MSVTFSSGPSGPSSFEAPAAALQKVALAGSWLRWLGAAIADRIAAIVVESRVRQAARELRMLDNHMLRDIGISRSEIDSIVRYGRAGDRNGRLS